MEVDGHDFQVMIRNFSGDTEKIDERYPLYATIYLLL